jgi:SAM-dependent methyltransferase
METDRLSRRYTDTVAEEYNQRRKHEAKWEAEQSIVTNVLGKFAKGTTVLDVPVGTGRFLELYKQLGFHATGCDVSADMLVQCNKTAKESDYGISLVRGSILNLGVRDTRFQLVVCIRFLNWVERRDFVNAIAELKRVASGRLVLGIRHLVPVSDLGFSRLVGQTRMKFRRWRNKGGLVFHKMEDVLTAFTQHGLSIEEKHIVEKRGDGTDYVIYVLSIRDHGVS